MMDMQLILFAEDNRLEKLTELGDSLLKLDVVYWESFRPVLEKAFQKERKSNAGRRSYDVVMMFKILVQQRLINISEEQTEFQINDRMSFMWFFGLSLGDRVLDAKTIWLYRENLTKAGVIDQLFIGYCKALERNGIIAHCVSRSENRSCTGFEPHPLRSFNRTFVDGKTQMEQ